MVARSRFPLTHLLSFHFSLITAPISGSATRLSRRNQRIQSRSGKYVVTCSAGQSQLEQGSRRRE